MHRHDYWLPLPRAGRRAPLAAIGAAANGCLHDEGRALSTYTLGIIVTFFSPASASTTMGRRRFSLFHGLTRHGRGLFADATPPRTIIS